uniref:Transposase n=1 Tax=Streptomyces sp. NBC_00119 TaxID=2975659 RepID=A0AAU1U3Q8_9ACTN
MPKPYPEEFREDVVRVARNRGPGVTVEQVAADFGVHAMTLWKWMRRADIDDGTKPGTTSQESAELREGVELQGKFRHPPGTDELPTARRGGDNAAQGAVSLARDLNGPVGSRRPSGIHTAATTKSTGILAMP